MKKIIFLLAIIFSGLFTFVDASQTSCLTLADQEALLRCRLEEESGRLLSVTENNEQQAKFLLEKKRIVDLWANQKKYKGSYDVLKLKVEDIRDGIKNLRTQRVSTLKRQKANIKFYGQNSVHSRSIELKDINAELEILASSLERETLILLQTEGELLYYQNKLLLEVRADEYDQVLRQQFKKQTDLINTTQDIVQKLEKLAENTNKPGARVDQQLKTIQLRHQMIKLLDESILHGTIVRNILLGRRKI